MADIFTILGAAAGVDRLLHAARDNREVALRHVRESPAAEPRHARRRALPSRVDATALRLLPERAPR